MLGGELGRVRERGRPGRGCVQADGLRQRQPKRAAVIGRIADMARIMACAVETSRRGGGEGSGRGGRRARRTRPHRRQGPGPGPAPAAPTGPRAHERLRRQRAPSGGLARARGARPGPDSGCRAWRGRSSSDSGDRPAAAGHPAHRSGPPFGPTHRAHRSRPPRRAGKPAVHRPPARGRTRFTWRRSAPGSSAPASSRRLP